MKIKKRFLKAQAKKIDRKKGQILGVIGSSERIDRYGEIVDASWLLDDFKENPVLLWAHNLTFGEERPPIGKALNVEVNDQKQLMFDLQFDLSDEFAADIFRKYAEGYLTSFSVGFIPHKIEYVDDDENPQLRRRLLNNELLELSAVPVPANPDAKASLQARSFSTKKWSNLLKEAGDVEEGDENDTPPKKKSKTTKIKAKKPKAKAKKTAPEDKTKGTQSDKPEEEVTDDSGHTPESKSPTLSAEEQVNLIVRSATAQLQEALRIANEQRRKARETSKGATQEP